MTASATETKTLFEFIWDLLHDDDARQAFQENPENALRAAGLHDISVHDVQELMPVILEHVDPGRAAHYEEHCDDDHEGGRHHRDEREHGDHSRPADHVCHPGCGCDDGHRRDNDDDHGRHHGGGDWKPAADCDDEGAGHRPSHHEGDTEIDKVITHLNFVTNNYSFDSHDTIFNTTNVTDVWAKNSTVTVDNDTTNNQTSADHGGVVVGGDNNGPVTTGDGNVVGDDNQVAGQGSTAAFGSGSAYSVDHVGANDGGAVSIGNGSATGNQQNTDLHDFGAGTVAAAGAGGSAAASDSHDTTNVDSHDNNGSFNDTDSHDNTGSFNDTDSHDNTGSFNETDNSIETNTSLHSDSHDNNDSSTQVDADHSSVDVHDPAFA